MCSIFPCLENDLGLSPLTKISVGTHARVAHNNKDALAEFDRNCETYSVITYRNTFSYNVEKINKMKRCQSLHFNKFCVNFLKNFSKISENDNC